MDATIPETTSAARRSSRRPGRRARSWAPILVVAVLAALLAVVAGPWRSDDGGGPAPGDDQRRDDRGRGDDIGDGGHDEPVAIEPVEGDESRILDYGEVLEHSRAAARGEEPWAGAVEDLVDFADEAVDDEPDPQQPLDIEGTEGPFVDDTTAAYALALAHVVTGEDRYADASLAVVDAWVETTEDTENTCRTDGSCQTSLIIGRVAPGFVFAVDLLRSAGVVDDADLEPFHDWLRDVILPTASERINNWGDAGNYMRFAVAAELGDEEEMARAVRLWRRGMDLVDEDGHIPEETRREKGGLTYTQEALGYKVATADLAQRQGVDLWNYEGAEGTTLKQAVDYLARYLADPGDWPWYDDEVGEPTPAPFWEIAYRQWGDDDYVPFLEDERPFGEQGHSAIRWTTLTHADA